MITIDQLRKALSLNGFNNLGEVKQKVGKEVFLIDKDIKYPNSFDTSYKNQITVYSKDGRLEVIVDCDRRDVEAIVGALNAAGLSWPSNANGSYDINC